MPVGSRQSAVPLVAISGVSALPCEADLSSGGGSEVCATRDGTIFSRSICIILARRQCLRCGPK
jgi:hypothetical protein